jgi:predicted O-methyltransferase YrrM
MGNDETRSITKLRSVFGDGPLYPAHPNDHFTVDGVEFVCDYRQGSKVDRFFIVKDPRFVDGYRELCHEFRGANVVELGIAEGGSAALIALLAEPAKLVAIDLDSEPVRALSEFIELRKLEQIVKPYYGTDQTDRGALTEIVGREIGLGNIDLVIDDASHQLEATRASFETLFPLLRPGGLYVIEDWNADHAFRDAIVSQLRASTPEQRSAWTKVSGDAPVEPVAATRPLTDLGVDLMLARASEASELVGDVHFGRFSMSVRRGPAEIDPSSFSMAALRSDHFGYLAGT